MHIVAIGGNGFIGRHFCRAAQLAGHRITVVGRAEKPASEAFDYLPGGLEALAASPTLLESADIICHLASSTIPATANRDPVGDIEQNLVPTVKLLEAMRAHGNKRILFLSSGGAVYGPPKSVPIAESHPLRPISAYGIGKAAIENYLSMYEQSYGFAPVIIRPANPYGPGQASLGQLGVVTTFVALALSGRPAVIWGDGSVIRDFVHIDDLVAMMLSAIQPGVTGTYNCGSGTGTSLSDLMAAIERLTGSPMAREYQPARSFDPPAIVLDIALAQAELGWTPQVSLDAGIRSMLTA